MTSPGPNFYNLQFTANRDPAQRNGFQYPILVVYAESDSVIITHTIILIKEF